MSKEIYISSTPHETRLAIVENDNLAEMYYERENEYTLAGSIYNGKVTRVLPGMQSSFVDIGLERDAFLYITDFMEEAGDTADFEASANAGDSGRPHSSKERAGRAPREQQTRTAEPSDAELFTQAVSGVEPMRPLGNGSVGSPRSAERGGSERGRRGGRNRGNRGGSRTDTARQNTASLEPSAASTGYPEEVMEPLAGNISIPDQPEEVGEGLPGADGSRRWRGRRGRRGNRNAGTGSQAQQSAKSPDEAVASPEDTLSQPKSETGPVYDAYGSSNSYNEGNEESLASSIDVEAASATDSVDREQSGNAGRNGRGNRERGERGRGGKDGRNERSDRSNRPAPPTRVPRGFAPSTDLYKVDQPDRPYGVEPEIEAPAEPIILPGESLSKYKAGSAAVVSESPIASMPVVDTYVAAGWDGGFVLPGETLRPRTSQTSSRNDEPQRGNSARSTGGDRDGRERDRNRGRRGERSAQEQHSSPHVFQSEPAIPAFIPVQASVESASDFQQGQHTEHEQELSNPFSAPIDSTFVPPPPIPHLPETPSEGVMLAASEPVEEPEYEEISQEYEPVDGSASYRIDPAPPQEFRQSSIVEDYETEQESERAPEPKTEVEFLSAVELPAEFQHETPSETHEMTALSDTGDLHSAPAAGSLHELPSQEELEPASPITHESAVVDQTPSEPTSAPQHFQPGTGILEEEMLDDGDFEMDGIVPAVSAHTQMEFEQAEQESIENGADLGVMLREMSIDQITRLEPSVSSENADDDEEDYEEDFLEEDQDFDSAEGEDSSEDVDQAMTSEEGADHVAEASDETFDFAEANSQGQGKVAESAPGSSREPRRDSGRRDNRRDSSDRSRRSHSGDRSGSTSGSDRSRRDNGHRGRPSMQATNLPAISDLLKPGQEILVQIAKEPIAKKGARITSHIALPGRFLVFMPTVSHTGVSRKIESDSERRRLKEILLSEKGDASGGFIVRTAAAGASEQELRSDLRFLLNLWADIKARSESSKSPALIYHDLNLIERVLRDQVTDNFSAIWVDSETEYERVLRFLQRFQPSLIRRVKLYTKETPLFEQFGITEEINKALRSKVWLKSGGSIVINQTEALVAIDINTGKFVGKTARLEDTIVKTNLDAIPEIVRQIRLRDLGGIIIIDFIDMDERKNRNKVMAALEEELKLDRAPSKVLQFNDFGLVAITRKRVKQSLERTLSTTCNVCQGTGMTKSPVTICNDIYVEMRKMSKHLDRGDVMLRVNPEVVKQLKAPNTHWLQEMEEMVGKTILVKSDPSLHPEQFDIH